MKDPLHPDNTLPYADHLKVLIIEDASTKQAAFRTGKIDILPDVINEDKEFFERTNPDLQWARYIPPQIDLTWRVDKEPFDDILVRKALWKAVDRDEIAEGFYGGDAVMQGFVAYPVPENSGYYTPLEELPDEARDIYIYDVDKAKELLTEAGYPDGFKTHILCTSTQVDLLSIIREYWLALGVDMEIRVLDSGQLSGIMGSYSHEQMVASGGSPYRPESFTQFAAGQRVNRCCSDDPIVNQARIDASATFMTDRVRHEQIVKDTIIHIIEQAYVFCPPAPYGFIGWQPWVKNYNGEQTVGGRGQTGQQAYFVWVDQELKKSMGY
jgi:peptide/nickel transport system substrate-binding protein